MCSSDLLVRGLWVRKRKFEIERCASGMKRLDFRSWFYDNVEVTSFTCVVYIYQKFENFKMPYLENY